MKKIITIILGLALSTQALAYSTLYEYYINEVGYFPTIAERVETAEDYGIENYKGTASQNVALLGALSGGEQFIEEDDFVVGGFRPSGYTGKLLTRLTEGGSESTFNTTPGTAPDGTTLTTAKIGDFIVITVNPGAANEEKISASAVSVSGTTATWTIINRGLSFTENTAVTANKKQHAIGETVIISNDDHYLSSQYPAKDEDATITGQWTFDVFPITPSSPAGSETTAGILELATGVEAASSTSSGSVGRLALPASLATSTYNSATAGRRVVVTQPSGKIDQAFLDLSAYTGVSNIASTSIATSTATTTAHSATTTWSKPANLRYLIVELVGGGGGGGGTTNTTRMGGAGAGGGYCKKVIPASALGATEIMVAGRGGPGGTAGSGGTAGAHSQFGSHCIGYGGALGTSELIDGVISLGGGASGGDINIAGQNGGEGVGVAGSFIIGGKGGDSMFGYGGDAGTRVASGSQGGTSGIGYGSGASGAISSDDSNDLTGGNGAPGLVILTYFFY